MGLDLSGNSSDSDTYRLTDGQTDTNPFRRLLRAFRCGRCHAGDSRVPSRNGCTDRVAVQSETRLGMCITRSAHWRHLANTTERRKRRRRCALWLPSLQRLVPVRTQITSHHIKYRSCSSRRTVCQQSAVARFLLQLPPSGTLYPTTFNLHHLFLPFAGS